MSEPQAQRVEEIRRGIETFSLGGQGGMARAIYDLLAHLDTLTTQHQAALAQARAEERAWWINACEDDFPCITAGRARGTCPHESFISCLLDAENRRQPSGSPGERGGQG